MYISKLDINNFRAFEGEYSFEFVKGVNCLSGHNATGKSTILAILSNCGELKKKDGEQLNGKAFRGEYSQLIKGDVNKDKTGDVCKLYFDDLPKFNENKSNPFVNELSFRATYQNGKMTKRVEKLIDPDKNLYEITKKDIILNNERYRLIPKKIKNIRDTERKLNWPVIYLGLSRLFPVGESESLNQSLIKTDYDDEISKQHKEILSSKDEYISLVNVDTDIVQKRGVGFDTEKYSYKANSSGQDNLGQILLALYSFENLKKSYKNYSGGLLLIDELDSTLHPAAQNRLLDFLVEKSQELRLQVFFTTHSQTLLEHINKRNERVSKSQKVTNHYLNNSRGSIELKIDPSTKFVKNNLQETYSGMSSSNRIVIITEDNIGRWFLNKILEKNNFEYGSNIFMPKISIGWTQLIKLIKNDYSTFKNHLIFLDPDLSYKDNRAQLNDLLSGTEYKNRINKDNGNIFFVELDKNIERVFYDYLFSLNQNDDFFYDPYIEYIGLNYDSLRNGGPNTNLYDNKDKELDKIKAWFNNNEHIVDVAFNYWYEAEKNKLEAFYKKFNTAFNRLFNSD
ncbi:ATP-dependent nuclease [Dolosigranulum pigrum]|uniref:ATP-dependent nuclease n=1 Tax=Dolosigranulum pigrum TaxID=29394 RepID=UPI00191B6D37|nr:AAA family ATPase [Dolosigranulum pigrum]